VTTTEPGDPRHDTVVRLLDDPALWAEVPSGLRESVLAEALGDQVGSSPDPAPEAGSAEVYDDFWAGAGAAPDDPGQAVPLHAARGRRAARSRRLPTWLAAAAAVVVVAGLGVMGGMRLAEDDTPADPLLEVALAGTPDAPGSSATARLTQEPAGISVTLDVSDLPPAPAGTFYEVWLVGETGKVSAGTFHMRGDQDEIKMWWGVEPDGYDAVTVTRQPIEGGTNAEGVVVLRGELPAG
jgi:hypothetical protein